MIQVTPEIAAGQFFDELIRADGEARPGADSLLKFLTDLSPEVLSEKRTALEAAIKSQGISFLVYSDSMNIDRSWPLDLVPRVMQASEWRHTEAGLKQRLKALNLFLNDVYNEQAILRDGIVPTELVTDSPHYIALASGMKPLFETWAHICGSDLVRDHRGQLFVLEDNLRVPSGVSYMLENRSVMKQVYPELFRNHHILPVSQYASDLLDMLNALSSRPVYHPVIVVLTPGIYNSAYFEHSYLAQQIGAELVQGSDLFVDSDDCVYMKAVEGVSRVDVIYRRIDDTFLDPEALNPDSVLGVPGLMRAWRAGKVSIANYYPYHRDVVVRSIRQSQSRPIHPAHHRRTPLDCPPPERCWRRRETAVGSHTRSPHRRARVCSSPSVTSGRRRRPSSSFRSAHCDDAFS